MSSDVRPDNSRDIQESRERQEEADARQLEAFTKKYGRVTAERIFADRERERQARIKRNEDRLDELEAQQGIIRGKAKRSPLVYHE